jgi:ABC-2 type transport system permease protein
VTGLLRGEIRKVMSTRMVWGLLIGMAVFTAANVAATVFGAGQEGVPSLDTEQGIRGVYASASAGTVFSLVLGILAVTGEYRHGTISTTFLVTPRRERVVFAKLVALPVVTFAYAVVAVVVTVALAAPLLWVKDQPVSLLTADVRGVLLGAVAGITLYSVLGVGFACIVRNQVAAVVGSLVWVMLGEAVLVTFLPEVGRWTPGGAAAAMTLVEPLRGGDLLPPVAGALLFVAYAVALAGLGLVTTVRRDIT